MALKTTNYQKALSITLRRLAQGDLSGVSERYLGRFPINRKFYSLLKSFKQLFNSKFCRENLNIAETSIIRNTSTPQEYVETLKQDSVAFGITLPDAAVDEIYNFACSAPCIAYGSAVHAGKFTYPEVSNGILRGQYPVALAEVQNLTACSAIEQLATDPMLLKVVRGYLGYWPTRIDRYMSWTMKINLPDEKIVKLNEPVVYHYDLEGYNTVRAYFYITDIDETSGPHVMIKGSHDKKTLKMMLSPAQETEDALYQYYGKHKEIVITGNRGLGFFQVPFCFHKATTPKTQDRLLLQLRYF